MSCATLPVAPRSSTDRAAEIMASRMLRREITNLRSEAERSRQRGDERSYCQCCCFTAAAHGDACDEAARILVSALTRL